MRHPPPWDTAIHARRHPVEALSSRRKGAARIALRRDKTRRRWIGFAHMAAAMVNLRLAEFSHTA